jgi:Flp pilus assembly protein TadG
MEVALTLPLVLLVSVSIFEFGRAYQTWQVLTNAAREGARVAVLPGATASQVQARVQQYMNDGALDPNSIAAATVTPDFNQTVSIGGAATASASLVTITYPFQFIVMNPVAQLVVNGSTVGSPFTMTVSAKMRNENQ